ncbi:MAG: bifunctional oligoribonuclease/PAP phosphatase NrnA [Bacilli bacterium]|nr:bifunctional oligoribonuclease/PAP phosphatase NrnA [Bacilli bacterium]
MDKGLIKKIIKQIKSHNDIVIARHISPDPDAICSQLALRDSIRKTFPHKNVYAVGATVSKFKKFGQLDKIDETKLNNPLLIVLDLPNILRIDGVDFVSYKDVIKIDHHPFEEKMGEIEVVDEKACSTCELIGDLIINSKMVLDEEVAKNIFLGIVSDSDRFLLSYTRKEVFKLVYEMVKKTNLDFQNLYPMLYERPLAEVKFHGYLAENIKLTEHGLGYLIIDMDVLKKYGVDSATPSNMINDFNYIKELLVWVFVTYDERNELYKFNIRSRGPIVNEVAAKYNGGGHKFACGIKTTDKREIENVLKDLDKVCKKFKEENNC